MLSPGWLSFDSQSGLLSGWPSAIYVGPTSVVVAVADDSSASVTQQFMLTVAHTNHAPKFAEFSRKQGDAVEDQPFMVEFPALDIDTHPHGDSLSYSLLVSPSWLSLDPGTGTVRGIPREGDIDTLFVIRVTDGIDCDTLTIPLAVRPVNDPPVFSGIPRIELREDSSVVLSRSPFVYDPDDLQSTMHWQVETEGIITQLAAISGEPDGGGVAEIPPNDHSDNLGITLDTTAALIRISARNNFWGLNIPIIVIVRDQGGLSCSDTLFISVLPVNDPPRVLTLPDSTALAGTPYASLVHAQDVDDGDDGITFTLSGSTWMSIDSTGKISGVPSRAGIEEIRLIVSDPWGAGGHRLVQNGYPRCTTGDPVRIRPSPELSESV